MRRFSSGSRKLHPSTCSVVLCPLVHGSFFTRARRGVAMSYPPPPDFYRLYAPPPPAGEAGAAAYVAPPGPPPPVKGEYTVFGSGHSVRKNVVKSSPSPLTFSPDRSIEPMGLFHPPALPKASLTHFVSVSPISPSCLNIMYVRADGDGGRPVRAEQAVQKRRGRRRYAQIGGDGGMKFHSCANPFLVVLFFSAHTSQPFR